MLSNTCSPKVYFPSPFEEVDGIDVEEKQQLGQRNKGFPLEIFVEIMTYPFPPRLSKCVPKL